MDTLSTILCIAGAAAIAAFIWYWKYRQDALNEFNEFKGKLPNNKFRGSKEGVAVYSEFTITDTQLADIDAGIAETLRRARRDYPNSPTIPTHKDFTVWLWPPSKKCEAPSIYQTFGKSVYDQGEYDKDPEPNRTGLCYAGKMILNNGIGLGMLLSTGLVQTACQYEAEHNVLYRIDRTRYAATANRHNHPLFPNDAEFTNLADFNASQRFKCGVS